MPTDPPSPLDVLAAEHPYHWLVRWYERADNDALRATLGEPLWRLLIERQGWTPAHVALLLELTDDALPVGVPAEDPAFAHAADLWIECAEMARTASLAAELARTTALVAERVASGSTTGWVALAAHAQLLGLGPLRARMPEILQQVGAGVRVLPTAS